VESQLLTNCYIHIRNRPRRATSRVLCFVPPVQEPQLVQHREKSNACNGCLNPACHGAGHGAGGHVGCHGLQLLFGIFAAFQVTNKVAAT